MTSVLAGRKRLALCQQMHVSTPSWRRLYCFVKGCQWRWALDLIEQCPI